jgi:hypothetical protein
VTNVKSERNSNQDEADDVIAHGSLRDAAPSEYQRTRRRVQGLEFVFVAIAADIVKVKELRRIGIDARIP